MEKSETFEKLNRLERLGKLKMPEKLKNVGVSSVRGDRGGS